MLTARRLMAGGVKLSLVITPKGFALFMIAVALVLGAAAIAR